ncbi:transcript variant X4 [Nothobranchius furzeri]|uniref:Transcript variant X4 n=1 Tax=Nothobranchius furzeri TaxID=105023 RepID=A0A9D2YJ05_NOTFU|nr:transcript variant X4 [Nothobranchius furzeri]
MEEEEEHSRYVAQLKAEFDSCDTTATGFLDRDELTVLCRKLQLDAHLALLLDTLLGPQTYGRVNFEEFKEGFISVLSRSLDFSTSEDNSSYLEPAIPEEVKPKFIKGTKCYGRRSHPDGKPDGVLTRDQDDSPLSRTETADPSPPSVRRAKLRRATSLESVESPNFLLKPGGVTDVCSAGCPQEQEEEVGGGGPVLTALCDHLGLQDVDVLLRTVAPDLDQAGVLSEVQKVLCSYAPKSNSTPIRSANLQRTPLRSSMQAQEVLEEPLARSASPSLLMATVGQRVLSRLDDGSGCTSPEQVVALWTEEGIHNSREILQTLDFTLEERLSLSDLTLALDNELLVSGNGIHQVALISYKNEIQHLLEMSERACRERDKLKTDLDLADQRNLQLIREVDDHHTNMETMNESRIRDMEQDFRERLMSLRCQSVEESEVLLRQVELERHILMEELQLLRVKDTELQEELSNITQEKVRLEEELDAVNVKLRDAESSVIRLQGDLKQLLQDKFGSLDPTGTYLSHEQKFSTIIKEYELQCRELQDRNDELSSELDLLKIQRSSRRSERSAGNDVSASELSWSLQHIESESDDSDMKQSSSPAVRKRLQPVDKIALSSLDDISVPAVSIQTELAVEQLKEKHQQEVQQLNIQLETQINYYERQLDMMKQSMEVERKDISQAFKLEISELEEQKSRAEQQVKQLKGTVDKLQTQIQQGAGGGARSMEQERKMHRERAELEQNFAREISNLVQRLSDEKEQLEAELKLKMDQEVMRVRTQLEEVRLENGALQERLRVLQQEVQNLDDEVAKKRRRLEEMEREHERSRKEEERLQKENFKYREEVLDLSSRNLQLSSDNGDLSAHLCEEQESVQMLQKHLATVSKEQPEEGATFQVQRLMEEKLQQQSVWLQQQEARLKEQQLLEKELISCKEKLSCQSQLEAELRSVMGKLLKVEEEKDLLQRDAKEQNHKVNSLQEEVERLQSELLVITQEKVSHAQEVLELYSKLSEAENQVVQLEANFQKLLKKEELHQELQETQEQASITLQEQIHRMKVQNQELQQQVSKLQVQEVQVQKLTQELHTLKSRLMDVEAALTQAQDQAVRADTALSVAKAQHLRQVQQLQQQAGCGEQVEVLQAQLEAEMKRSQQLEEVAKLQVQQSGSQIIMKQKQFDKATVALQQRVEELEAQLKALRLVLQEKINQLKEQLVKNNRTSEMMKDLYVENSQLMKALQVTELRQKEAEKKNLLFEEKVRVLNQLLREAVATVLAT